MKIPGNCRGFFCTDIHWENKISHREHRDKNENSEESFLCVLVSSSVLSVAEVFQRRAAFG